MKVSVKPAFYYHANANAIGGVLKQPLERIVSTPGSVSLAQAGGFGTSRVDRFDLEGLVSFEMARVTVSGTESKGDGGWRTVSTATVEGLNVLSVVTADRIVSQVSVMHFYDRRPAEVSFNGTQFVNLRVNHTNVDPKLDFELLSRSRDSLDPQSRNDSLQTAIPRFSTLIEGAKRQYQEGATSRKSFAETCGARFVTTDPESELKEKGTALCSLVNGVTIDRPALASGHRIFLPDFGSIFLGELRVNYFSAQLTMLRLEMGCIADGDLSVGSAYSNGATMP
jgi:hypothetical protein